MWSATLLLLYLVILARHGGVAAAAVPLLTTCIIGSLSLAGITRALGMRPTEVALTFLPGVFLTALCALVILGMQGGTLVPGLVPHLLATCAGSLSSTC